MSASLTSHNTPRALTPINASNNVHRALNAIRSYFEYQEERNGALRDENNTLDHFKRLRPPSF